ncbi:MAG: AMP-binding protein [Deferrisomatales bacterium]
MAELKTLASLVDGFAERGDAPAVVQMRPEGPDGTSFVELGRRARRCASGLRGQGLRAGDRVVLWAESSPAWIAASLAVIRAGGVVTPLDVQLGREALVRILEDSEPRYLLTTARRSERLEEIGNPLPPVLFLDRPPEAGKSVWELPETGEPLPRVGEEDPAALFYTSGTTGPPKGVPLTHGNLVFQLNRVAETGLALPEDRFLVPLPFHHVYPFSLGMLLPLAQGLPIVLPQALTGPEIVRAAREAEATVLLGVPRLHRALSDAMEARLARAGVPARLLFRLARRTCGAARRRLGVNAGRFVLAPVRRRIGPRLRVLASGGGPLDPDLAADLEALGWDIAIGYGLTETAPLLTVNPPGSGRHRTVGRPLPGVELRIDRSAATGGSKEDGRGEILARAPSVFSGYRNLPDETREAFTEDGWFRTGDLGEWEEGGFLRILGRVSTRIVTESGENVQPEEVEEAYEASPVLREVGVLEEEGRLVGLVMPDPGAAEGGRDPREDAVRRAVSDRSEALPSHQRLTAYALTDRPLPCTRLGKIRRHRLAERYRSARAGEEDREGRQPVPVEEMGGEDRWLLEDPAARAAWDLLTERYPDRGLTPDAHLAFDLGVDSLEWVALSVELEERTGVQWDEEAIASFETVRDLLQSAAEGREAGGSGRGSRPLEEPEEFLGEAQRLWLEPPGPWSRALGCAAHGAVRAGMRIGFRLRVEGREHVPSRGAFVIAPNHLSFLDPFALAAALDRPTLERTYWAGWTGIAFRNAAVRLLSRLARVVPVDPHRAAASSLASGAAVLRRDRSLVWFPEGTRSKTGELQDFRPGIGLLLEHYPVPVIPAHLDGSWEAMPPGRFLPRLRPIRLRFGEALDPRELEEASQGERPRDRITGALRERVAELGRSTEGS